MTRSVQQLKRLIKTMAGKDLFVSKDCQVKCQRLGSRYGGWDVAVDRLDNNAIIYSFGVGQDASFDLALIEKTGATVHAFDPTPKSIQWVRAQDFPAGFIMHEYGIADFDGTVTFNPPADPDHVSHTILQRAANTDQAIEVTVKSLQTIMNELRHDDIDLLKMDVEGAEYAVIENIESAGIRPGQLLIEFHHRFPSVGIARTRQAIKIVRQMGYRLFSVSDSGEEFSFIYKGE